MAVLEAEAYEETPDAVADARLDTVPVDAFVNATEASTPSAS